MFAWSTTVRICSALLPANPEPENGYGGEYENTYHDDVLGWMNERLEHYWKMQVVAGLKAEGTHSRPVPEREALLREAKEIGGNL